MGIEHKIKGCIVVEAGVAAVYRAFMERFSGDAAFWARLAKEELEHEEIFRSVEEFGPYEENPDDPLQLPPESLIASTIHYVEALFARMGTTALTRKEAFEIAVKLEENMIESYLNEALEAKDLCDVEGVVEQERVHLDQIASYMDQQGLKPYS